MYILIFTHILIDCRVDIPELSVLFILLIPSMDGIILCVWYATTLLRKCIFHTMIAMCWCGGASVAIV